MTTETRTDRTDGPLGSRPLRLWPGVAAVTLQWLVFLSPLVFPGAGGTAILGGVAGGALVLLWWLFFSRAPWTERLGAVGLMVAAVWLTKRVVHPSIANGMMGMMLPLFSVPLLSLALVAWAAGSRRLARGPRLAALAAAVAVVCGATTLVRTSGVTGDAVSEFHWRWTPSPEERLLAQATEAPAPAPVAPGPADPAPAAAPTARPADPVPPSPTASAPEAAAGEPAAAPPPAAVPSTTEEEPQWPGFRGPGRDGVVRGARLTTDWSRHPPVEMWRRPIGPAWSSFAVQGDVLYTQEQRGEEEIVSAYRVSTGEPVWMHRDAARFWESNAGAGPRATPALAHGRVYTLGGTGILNALDARDGSLLWSRNAVADTGAKVPSWGIASSPLVAGDLVIVAPNGWPAAYDAANGQRRWSVPRQGGSYSSPQLSTLGGVSQIVLLSGAGAIGLAPSDGKVLWQHAFGGSGIVQPALMGGGDVLLGSGSGAANNGVRRLAIAHEGEGWSVEERWTTGGLKPYFNDFVVHAGHAFGFDGSILACIDLADGQRKWKGGRYGHGQLLLLPDQDLLLVLSEKGELALVKAAPDGHEELARFKAIEGKTWNHPVLVDDVLLVRNGEEMAAFRLAGAGSAAAAPAAP